VEKSSRGILLCLVRSKGVVIDEYVRLEKTSAGGIFDPKEEE
jgi:hypothetical protein